MEEGTSIRLVSQFLHEHGFKLSLESLQEESGRKYDPGEATVSGELQSILDDYSHRMKQKKTLKVSVDHLFPHGQGEYANTLLKSLDDVSGGVNILVVRLIENRTLIFGASKSLIGIGEFMLPFSMDKPPMCPIFTMHTFCNGGVLALDVHPLNRNLILCGSMDCQAFILDLSQTEDILVQKFENHGKYVVRVLWSTSGKFFVTASYDKTICVYRLRYDDSKLHDNVKKIPFKGVIESLAFSKDDDTFVVGVRNDYLLHCYDLSSGTAVLSREINMNAFGDDYVSFVPMHMSFSPDGQFILISTGLYVYALDRTESCLHAKFGAVVSEIRIFKEEDEEDEESIETDLYCIHGAVENRSLFMQQNYLIAIFYGATNDEYSQPRHCWDYSGKYIYSTSQDKSIVVWEIRSQNVVTKLEGHTATVRDLHFCHELKTLVSCGYDGSVKLWKNVQVL